MSGKLITVAKFPNALAAHAARGVLDGAGIPATVVGDVVATDLSYFGQAAGFVSLQVTAEDFPEALKLLEELESDDETVSGRSKCESCGADIEEGFDTCWSCGVALDVTSRVEDQPDRVLADRPEEVLNDLDQNSSDDDDENETDRVLVRAWRSAVLGIIIVPPLLTLYSLSLLVNATGMPEPRTERARWCRTAATVLDVIALFTAAAVIFALAFG